MVLVKTKSYSVNVWQFVGSHTQLRNKSSTKSEKPCFFVIFKIIVSYIFPENLSKIYELFQKIRGFYSSVLTIFTNSLHFLTFPY